MNEAKVPYILTLEAPYMLYYGYTCCTCTIDINFQSVFLCEQPCWVTGHFETFVHRMIPKKPWTLQDKMYPIYMLLVSQDLTFQSVSLYRFRVAGHVACLRKVHRMTTKELRTWTLQGQRYTIWVTNVPESQIPHHFSPRWANFRDTCTLWSKIGDARNDLILTITT